MNPRKLVDFRGSYHSVTSMASLTRKPQSNLSCGETARHESDERVLLREVVYASDDKCITLRTGHHTFKLDVRKVDPSETCASQAPYSSYLSACCMSAGSKSG
jgi:hypothetical protein